MGRARIIVAIVFVGFLAGAIAYARFFARPPSASIESPTPVETASPAESATPSSGSVSPTLAATPTAAPTTINDPNLLSYVNGAFARRWTVGGGGGGNTLATGGIYTVNPAFPKPVTFVFEMPSAGHITRLGTTVSTTGPLTVHLRTGSSIDALHDAGTIQLPKDDGKNEHSVDVNVDARYVEATFERRPATVVTIFRVAAYGTPGPPERGSFAGMWVAAGSPSADGDVMFPDVKGSVPNVVPEAYRSNAQGTLVRGNTFADFWCDRYVPAMHGTISGNLVTGPNGARLQLAGDGKLLVGYSTGIYDIGGRVILMRDNRRGGSCDSRDSGNGPTVLALVRDGSRPDEPEVDSAYIPGYHFHRVMPMLLDQSMLARAQFVVLVGDCTASNDLLPYQQQLLLNWVASGHKLIIRDSDECNASDYSFIPYKFITAAAGAHGARGSVLNIADPSTLGSGPSDPAHFLDTAAYVREKTQDLGDADVMQTEDMHWCGHLFSRNLTGASGWAHAYARYGRGLIIYDGIDRDDLDYHDAPAIALVRYEYAQPVQGRLPCNVQVASALALYPAVDRRLAAGTPATLRVPLSLTYVTKAGSDQHVALAIAGDAPYAAHVTPPSTAIHSGQTLPVFATISLPKGWNGVHAFTVTAKGGFSAQTQTSITIDGSVALAHAFKQQRRVRIYGIHFDVDSATILPESEATISQIAAVLRANPSWRMRVEGYTDSDGGAIYNLALSDRRAHSVVADLVAHYKISSSRLFAAGFGLTNPVAPNTTAGGKALNRRVELVRL